MVRLLLISILIFGSITKGADTGDKDINPCLNPILMKVEQNGIKSLKFYQLPVYYWAALKCKRINKQSQNIQRHDRKQLDQDYKQAYRLEGAAYTCTYIAAVAVLVFYASAALKKT